MRHREAASAAVAIQCKFSNLIVDCFASLAMTATRLSPETL
jgi:hypothetical protein